MFNNIEELKNKLIELCGNPKELLVKSDYGLDTTLNDIGLFAKIYGKEVKYIYTYTSRLDAFKFLGDDYDAEEDESDDGFMPTDKNNFILMGKETIENLDNYFFISDRNVITLFDEAIALFSIYFTHDGKCAISVIKVISNSKESVEEACGYINEKLVKKDKKKDDIKFYMVSRGSHGEFTKIDFKLNCVDIDIKKNYNDDLPYEKIDSKIKSDRHELILLYGDPGTGKTTLIKKLIQENKDKVFMFVDSRFFEDIDNGQVLDFLINNRNSVFIMEDCEKLVTSREHNGSGSISAILNLTDGMIGDSLKFKFICTFNTKINEIDEALLRKGRLSVKYEFKKLELEKAKQINPNATKPMTLAELYYDDENDFSKNETRRIGF